MTKPKLTIGGVDLSTNLKAFDASASGPGVIGMGTMHLEALGGGGISILNRMDVKLWLPFNDAGAGVADRGRVFGGLVEDRDENTIGTTKTWDLTLSDWNLLGDTTQRDAAGTHVITLTAGTFAAQMATIVQVVQENGFGVVASQIDASTGVADLHATMPAQVLPAGKKLGWYIQALCLKAQELNTALRPQWFIGWGNTFGVGDTFGGPVLWVYDGALTPAPAFAFSDAPVGAEKLMFNAVARGLDSTGMVQRRQSIFNTGQIATYSDTSAQSTYPNPYINHNRIGNTGYWGLEPVEDRESRTFAEAEAKLRGHVLSHSTPRETIEFETPERVKPGEVVTITWPLYSLSAASKRVAGVGTHYEPPDTLWSRVILNRRRTGLFAGEEGIEAPPEEGLPPRPLAVTNLDVPINVYDEARREAHLVATFTPSVTGTTARHIAIWTIGTQSGEEETGDATTDEIHIYGPAGVAYDVTVVAEDHWRQRSLEFTPHETGTSASPGMWPSLPNPSFEEIEPVDSPSEPPAHWTEILAVNGGSSTTSTVQHLGGDRALILIATGVTSEVKRRCDLVVGLPSTTYYLRVPNRGSVNANALFIAVETLQGGSLFSTIAIANDQAVSANWEVLGGLAEYTFTTPAGIDALRLVLGVVSPNTAVSVYIDDVVLEPQLTGPGIKDGAIGNAQLGTITDASKIQLRTDSTNVRGIYDISGVKKGEEFYSANYITYQGTGAGVGVAISSTTASASLNLADATGQAGLTGTEVLITRNTGTTRIVMDASGILHTVDAADIHKFVTGSVVTSGAALTTTATGGFLYIPTCAGTPTGTPVAQTGTVPMVYDTTNKLLYVYSAGAWFAV